MNDDDPEGSTDPYQPPNTPVYQAPGPGENSNPTLNPLAVVSLVLGVLSFLVCCCILLVPFPLASGVCGAIAISQINKEPHRYKGKEMAIAGIAISVSVVVLYGLLIVLNIAGAITAETFAPR